MKKYSRKEIRVGQLEALQIKAYQTLTFLRGRLLVEETTEETDIVDTIDRILRWDRILLATCRLLGSSSELVPVSETDLLLASLTQDPDEHQVDALIAASVAA